MATLSRCLLILIVLADVQLSARAWANWERVNTRTVQETTLNSSQSTGFRRDTLNAVSALGIDANASLIQLGQWNAGVPFSPTTAGGTFSLLQSSHSADPAPLNGFAALGAASSERSTRSAPNQLNGWMTPAGDLRAAPGTRASEVTITATQTLSVF